MRYDILARKEGDSEGFVEYSMTSNSTFPFKELGM